MRPLLHASQFPAALVQLGLRQPGPGGAGGPGSPDGRLTRRSGRRRVAPVWHDCLVSERLFLLLGDDDFLTGRVISRISAERRAEAGVDVLVVEGGKVKALWTALTKVPGREP